MISLEVLARESRLLAASPLFPGEAACSYMHRLAAANAIDCTRIRKHLSAERKHASAQMSRTAVTRKISERPYPDRELSMLRALKGDQLTARICPCCLSGDATPYLREGWDLQFSLICHTHQVRLIERCERCEDVVSSARASLARCNCGASLSEQRTVPVPSWLYRVIGVFRIDRDGSMPMPVAKPSPRTIVRHLSRGPRAGNEKFYSGHESGLDYRPIADADVDQLRPWFENWPHAARSHPRHRELRSLFHRDDLRHQQRMPAGMEAAFDPAFRVVYEAVPTQFTPTSGPFPRRRRDIQPDWRALAERSGISEGALHSIARGAIDVRGLHRPERLTQKGYTRLRVRELLSITYCMDQPHIAASVTGFSEVVVRALAGGCVDAIRSTVTRNCILVATVTLVALLRRLRSFSEPTAAPAPGAMPLNTFLESADKLGNLESVVRALVRGTIATRCDPAGNGLATDFLVSADWVETMPYIDRPQHLSHDWPTLGIRAIDIASRLARLPDRPVWPR